MKKKHGKKEVLGERDLETGNKKFAPWEKVNIHRPTFDGGSKGKNRSSKKRGEKLLEKRKKKSRQRGARGQWTTMMEKEVGVRQTNKGKNRKKRDTEEVKTKKRMRKKGARPRPELGGGGRKERKTGKNGETERASTFRGKKKIRRPVVDFRKAQKAFQDETRLKKK